MARKPFGQLFKQLKFVDECTDVDKSDAEGFTADRMNFTKERFDLLLCPHRSARSMRLILASKAQSKSAFFNPILMAGSIFLKRYDHELPDALRQLSLLTPFSDHLRTHYLREAHRFRNPKQLGPFSALQIESMTLLPSPPAWAANPLIERDTIPSPFIALAPGSQWETKAYHLEELPALLDLLAKHYPVRLLGAASEKHYVPKVLPNGVENWVGKLSLYDTFKMIQSSRLLLSGDSGAGHLAALANTPSLTLFGPTSLAFGFRPWSSVSTCLGADLICRPCRIHGSRRCPLDHHHCMRVHTPGRLLEVVQKILTLTENPS